MVKELERLVGNNMFFQYGIEKQLAINLGNIAEAKTKKFFSELHSMYRSK